MNRPKRPTTLTGKPTAAQLRAWYEELKKYEATLQRWDDSLSEREAELEALFDDDEDPETWFCKTCMTNHVGDRIDPNWPCWGERMGLVSSVPAETIAGAEAEIEWLETLYKLPDRRRKKKTQCDHGIEYYNNSRDTWVCKKCGREKARTSGEKRSESAIH